MTVFPGWGIQIGISFRLVTVYGNPILDTLLGQAMASHKVVINMIEALGPRVQSFLLELHELGAESTPETGLAITADTTGFDLDLDSLFIGDMVLFAKMILEGLLPVTDLGAGSSFASLLIASPCL